MSTATVLRNFSYRLGETWTLEVYMVNSLGEPLDLTTANTSFRMSKVNASNANVLTVTEQTGHIGYANAVGGVAVITIDPTDQADANLKSDWYHYEIQVTQQTGVVSIQYAGDFFVDSSNFA